jgi:RsiW-degrading membrane proteinase PrsW (M82 family)
MSMAQQQPVVRQRAAWWQSAILAVVGVLVFVGIVIGLDAAFQPQLTGTSLIIVGIILATVPAILWLVFFYLQDHVEPEPKREVFKIFIVGLALASAIGIPLTDQVFRVEDWLYRSSTSLVLGSIFVIGAIEAFIIYLTVRHFIYDSDEFNERTDGMVYGTAAGLGYATALNVQFILGSGGAALGGAEVFIAEVALAHAAFAGVLGYFLGRAFGTVEGIDRYFTLLVLAFFFIPGLPGLIHLWNDYRDEIFTRAKKLFARKQAPEA